jgi:CBS domain containing-hemolysin-like protein
VNVNSPYAVLPNHPLHAGSTFGPQTKPLTIVRLESPAVMVMTDFAAVTPVTIDPETSIELAVARMRTAGVHMLFVVNAVEEIIGLITARDVLGERPIKITEATRRQHSDISVAEIMTPQEDIQVLDAYRVEGASVGDIVETMQARGRQHALVAGVDRSTGRQHVTGMFSTTHIAKVLGYEVGPSAPPAGSLAEIVRKMA